MPADLRTMLAASEAHDATVGIADRDLPQPVPAYHELTAIADRIMVEIKSPLGACEAIHTRHSIISALIEVRHDAALDASMRAYGAVQKVIGR